MLGDVLIEFQCSKCGNPLTHRLVEKPDDVEFCEPDGEDLLAQGLAARDFEWHDGQWVINRNDRRGMDVIKDPSRCNGCCDLDGIDGFNLVCMRCSQEVATAKLDCWMPHYILLDTNRTNVIEVQ